MISRVWKHKLFRYLLAGGLSYAVELGLIMFLVYTLAVGEVSAVAIAFWVGLLVAFALQKMFTFSNKTSNLQSSNQLVQYMLLVGFNYVFTLGVVAALSDAVGVAIARTSALVITTAWNFMIYNKFIFKNEKDN